MIKSFPPVTIEAARLGKPTNICSVTQAAEFLFMKWPIYDGPRLKIARQLCFDALEGEAGTAEARAAFIDAAKEANIFHDYLKESA
ncbi:DUF982 domain-containing protein [Phyllobacterium sp. SYP-B3895]|uniref:DUF982 domain-containing protein n=1 Tax=Phyllobacterium sp. SYP-B3895 TaxID=2663240 RepID=UPI001299C47E|nr:DUF982 domain-containing protein [Phyllobacterium sp. SYP-B3895]MRG54648.1 DUF982 domain-containing protein [Phyllobacterium sp. SYP-B3895]